MTKAYHIVFDGFPSPDGPRFIELENDDGKSINAGEWKDRADGLTELVLPVTPAPTHSLRGPNDDFTSNLKRLARKADPDFRWDNLLSDETNVRSVLEGNKQ
jgi:hypothetical protein